MLDEEGESGQQQPWKWCPKRSCPTEWPWRIFEFDYIHDSHGEACLQPQMISDSSRTTQQKSGPSGGVSMCQLSSASTTT